MPVDVKGLLSIVSDFVPVCESGGFVDNRLPIGEVYANGSSSIFMLWFIDLFVTDSDHKSRFMRSLREVDGFAADVAKRYRDRTGEPLHIPPDFVDELKRRIIRGYFPGVDEIVREAKHGQPARAAAAMLKTVDVDSWRKRF